MKTKQQIVEAYKRYLASLNGKGSDIIGNFDAIYKHITNNCEGEIYQALLIDCIGKTIKAVKEKGLRLKEMASEWNKASIDRFFEILGKLTSTTSSSSVRKKNHLTQDCTCTSSTAKALMATISTSPTENWSKNCSMQRLKKRLKKS